MPDAQAVHDHRVREWMAAQRWYPGTGVPHLALVGSAPVAADGSARTLLVRDEAERAGAVYQVPVAVGAAPGAGDGGDVAGAIAPTEEGVLVDGPRDAGFVAALVDLLLGGGERSGTDGTALRGLPLGWTGAPPAVAGSRVLSGEQSNTSVVVDAVREDGTPVALIVKLFRAVHAGENPDVVLQSAIAAAGSDRVPATFGALAGTWPDRAASGGLASGHLAVAQEFLAGTEDAWRVALVTARAGEDFTGPARALGAATAEVHRVLAGAFPVTEADDAAREALLAGMRSRAARALELDPRLAGAADAIEATLTDAAAAAWPPLQRVHGDFHLGQVLLVPQRGWVLLDFEGEPLRPMAERSAPDLALRDVAGMLRSFDYVAGTIEQEGGDAAAARDWADDAREAFLTGYEEELGAPLAPWADLLRALELDKALYECEYEVRNRPDWLPIPERAVLGLTAGAR